MVDKFDVSTNAIYSLVLAFCLCNNPKKFNRFCDGLISKFKKVPYIGQLLSSKMILIFTMLGMIRNERWCLHTLPGSELNASHLKTEFNLSGPNKLHQVIKSISNLARIQDHQSQEVVCIGLRKLSNNYHHFADYTFPHEDLYFFEADPTSSVQTCKVQRMKITSDNNGVEKVHTFTWESLQTKDVTRNRRVFCH